MIKFIKKLIPKTIKNLIITVLKRLKLDILYKKIIVRKMRKKHTTLLKALQEKNKIRVVFLAIDKSMWKLDTVFQKMLQDPYFDPVILICPITVFGEEVMWHDLEDSYNYFTQKKYPVISSYNHKQKKWLTLEDLGTDIVFFTSPHCLTRKEYYQDAYFNYLSCYVPYSYSISKYDNYTSQYNQIFHNSVWSIFAPHTEDFEIFQKFSCAKANNVTITGYPFCEMLLDKQGLSPWKKQEKNKLKIIWAPHHTIDKIELQYANFLIFHEYFKKIAQDLKEHIQFAFKPHPVLKPKLYLHPNWGKQKTDDYYNFWSNQDNTQLEDGEYIELFKHSDALIHDSGSFLAEYHYVNKPAFYICNKLTKKSLNSFGLLALDNSYTGETQNEVYNFIQDLISNKLTAKKKFQYIIQKYYGENSPSEKIIEHLKLTIQGDN